MFARFPDVGAVVGLVDLIDPGGRLIRRAEPWRLPSQAVSPPFGNGPLSYRRELFEQAGGYRRECEYWEDHDLLFRMAEICRVIVIPRALYQVRQARTGTRLVSDPSRVERALDVIYRSRDCLAQRSSYEQLLREGSPPTAKLDPRVFVARGTLLLWSGQRPRLFRRLLDRGKLSFNRRSLSSLVWTAWASASPTSLRAFLKLLGRARKDFRLVEKCKAIGRFTGRRPVSRRFLSSMK